MLLLLNKVRQDRAGDTTSPPFVGWGVGDGNSKIDYFILLFIYFVCLAVPGYTPVDVQPVPGHI